MYDRKYLGCRTVKARFKDGVEEFVTYAMTQDIVESEGGIRCRCIKCKCGWIESPEDIITHLEKFGFMKGYYVWRHHGEREPANINTEFDVNTEASSSGAQTECGNFGRMQQMVGDALGRGQKMQEELRKIREEQRQSNGATKNRNGRVFEENGSVFVHEYETAPHEDSANSNNEDTDAN
ncbi:hypothetical protein TSUD_401130 [Trifolium subterraneum]|uniref:Transposase-associated domain-containing protein n=1 Tax=Trifolium subterraneum TaxID=3900 RepID=A0A2Z6NUS6_TRISU|nr:hypothetical protein TSUD_401130 [Trifolium subterraneum]